MAISEEYKNVYSAKMYYRSAGKNKMNQIDIFTWEQFDIACYALAKQIQASPIKFYGLYGIPRGGLMIAVRLSHLLNIQLHTIDPRLSNIKRVLICDDISDSGNTLAIYKKEGYKIATIHLYPSSKVKPDFYTDIKHDKYIVYPWEKKQNE